MYDYNAIYQAVDIEDALRALREDEKAILISGGSDVLIQIREGRLAGCSLVSIHNIEALKGITLEENGTLRIGAATTFSTITNHPLIQQYIPMLGDAVDQVGGPQIRNVGTIGGNVCNGVTSADSAASLFTLNAILELTGSAGVREVPIASFYTGPGKTIRQHDEILTAIRIRREDYEGYYGRYIKYGKRNAMEIATLGCAVLIHLTEDKQNLQDIRIAYGVAAPTPIRCHETEQQVSGQPIGESLLHMVSKGVLSEVHPRSSWRASKEFRLQLIEELAGRALREAIEAAGGQILC
ncbi:MAG: xanthine dehydrogenase FAD-binding subunit XdhB [Lachnospiraceae bacterium]